MLTEPGKKNQETRIQNNLETTALKQHVDSLCDKAPEESHSSQPKTDIVIFGP